MTANPSTAAADTGAPLSSPDPRVVIFASGVIHESKRAEFIERVSELRRRCLADPGTLAWEWFTDRAKPSVVWVYEEYADDAALAVHRETVLPVLRPMLDCFAEPLVPHRCVPLIAAPSAG